MKNLYDVLTPKQDKKAFDWLCEHITHVRNLIINSDGNIFPPSLEEDKNQPNQWKSNHWVWYSHVKENNILYNLDKKKRIRWFDFFIKLCNPNG